MTVYQKGLQGILGFPLRNFVVVTEKRARRCTFCAKLGDGTREPVVDAGEQLKVEMACDWYRVLEIEVCESGHRSSSKRFSTVPTMLQGIGDAGARL
jgi:hypothetical protein